MAFVSHRRSRRLAPAVIAVALLSSLLAIIWTAGPSQAGTISSFQATFDDAVTPTWRDTIDTTWPGGSLQSMGGVCCNLSAPEFSPRAERAHSGTRALMYSGKDMSTSRSYAYAKIFDLSATQLAITSTTQLSYWVFPETPASTWAPVSSPNSSCVAIDLVFGDGTNLRDSGSVDQNGNRLHPGLQCTALVPDRWNLVTSNIGLRNAGKNITRIDVGYDQPANTGGFRGYIDDIRIAAPDTAAASDAAAPPDTAAAAVGAPWNLVFEENFNTNVAEGGFLAAYPNWGAYPCCWRDTSKNGTYDPSILSVSNGMMNMHLHTTSDGVRHVAAPLPNRGGDQLYGRFEIRFRADPVPGYKTSWMLWPQSNNLLRDGEIDFPEGELDSIMHAFMHHTNATSGGDQDWFGTSSTGYTDWHTTAVEWSPSKVVFILDGRIIGTSTDRIPNTPMHWNLQTETEISSSPPDPSARGYVQVDYVKIWTYSP